MIFGSANSTNTTVTWWKANPGFADVYPKPPEPVFEPTPGLATLEGRIWAEDFKRRVRRLLALLAALARFQSWALSEILRWLHAAAGPIGIQLTTSRRRRVCGLESAYRVRGPPKRANL